MAAAGAASLFIAHETETRLLAFAASFILCAWWEALRPARALGEARTKRWPRNFALLVLNTAVLRLSLPVLAVGTAIWAEDRHIGLFHTVALPGWLAGVLSIIALDFVLYAQHRLLHRVPLLWRLHRTHHLDADLDVSSGVRFHPLEILFSMAVKMAAVAALGVSAAAVIAFEILLNTASLFTHSNATLGRAEGPLSRLMVTPALHRMHHSRLNAEHNRNFGFFLSIWDRMLGTMIPATPGGPLELGLGYERGSPTLSLPHLIADPFSPGKADS